MKRLVVVLVVALASAVTTYLLVGLGNAIEVREDGVGANLAWIKSEFALDEAQFAAVRRLHDEYSGACAQHCADIVAARARLDAIAALEDTTAHAVTRAAAAQRVVELEAVCNDATRAHLRRVAAVMPSAQGKRFLELVEPHLAQLPHDGARLPSR